MILFRLVETQSFRILSEICSVTTWRTFRNLRGVSHEDVKVFRFEDVGLLVGYHGEPKVNLFHNIRFI